MQFCKRFYFLCAFFILFSHFVYGQALSDDFSMGEKLFSQNKSNEAIPYLKKCVDNKTNPKAFNYLAVAYFQNGRLNDALEVCEAGLSVAGTDKKVLSYNAGNICFAKRDFVQAEKYYSMAISADSSYWEPVLNRANARLYLGKYKDSRQDYINYLELKKDDPQQENIEKMIALLEEQERLEEEKEQQRLAEEERLKQEEERIAAQRALEEQRLEEERKAFEEIKRLEEERLAEERRIAEEELRIEQERLAEEQKEKEEAEKAEKQRLAEIEAEKRKKLLEQVAASLQVVEAENISAGAEGIVDYDYESELE